jgi:hypothetical protein
VVSRAVACAALVLTGCVAFAVPPIHAKLGAAYSNKRVEVRETQTTHSTGNLAVALDSASFSEQPIHVAIGVEANVSNSGWYIEGGWMRRLLPRVRLGIHGASEKLWETGGGYGLRTGITIEYSDDYVRVARRDYDAGSDGTHNQTTTYGAVSGTWAVGAFVDAGHRWMERDPDTFYITTGLLIRFPAMAGVVDLTGVH